MFGLPSVFVHSVCDCSNFGIYCGENRLSTGLWSSLDLWFSGQHLVKFKCDRHVNVCPPFLSRISTNTQRVPPLPLRRVCCRHKRAGRLVKLKAGRLHVIPLYGNIWSTCLQDLTGYQNPVVGWSHPRRRSRAWRGVNLRRIWQLHRIDTADVATSAPARIALFNGRSLLNKTYILYDFIISQGLDILYVMETWIVFGESSAFSELLPNDFTDFSMPRKSCLSVSINQ